LLDNPIEVEKENLIEDLNLDLSPGYRSFYFEEPSISGPEYDFVVFEDTHVDIDDLTQIITYNEQQNQKDHDDFTMNDLAQSFTYESNDQCHLSKHEYPLMRKIFEKLKTYWGLHMMSYPRKLKFLLNHLNSRIIGNCNLMGLEKRMKKMMTFKKKHL
jgi:hypothetical protein